MLMVFSVTYLMPIAASLIYGDGTWIDFVDAMVIAFGVGALPLAADAAATSASSSRATASCWSPWPGS